MSRMCKSRDHSNLVREGEGHLVSFSTASFSHEDIVSLSLLTSLFGPLFLFILLFPQIRHKHVDTLVCVRSSKLNLVSTNKVTLWKSQVLNVGRQYFPARTTKT